MDTDKPLFRLFSACPNWLFELAGLPSPGASEFRSFTVKALERRSDGLIVPQDTHEPLRIVEFEFRRDEGIYRRVVTEMIAAQEDFQGRMVHGMIFFGSRRHDPKTKPWTQLVQSFVMDDLLKDFQKKHPNHPLSAVFQPLLETQANVLESTAVEHFRTIQQSSLSARRKAVLTAIFVDWLEQRFPEKHKREIEIMLLGELPALEETQSGKDLIRIGLARGRAEGEVQMRTADIVKIINLRFATAPQSLQSRIGKLTPEQRARLLEFVVTCQSLTEIRDWLKREKK